MVNPTSVARAIMFAPTATSRGIVLRFVDQQAIDRTVRRSQGTLQLRPLRLTLMRWMFHYKKRVPKLMNLRMQMTSTEASNNLLPANLPRRELGEGVSHEASSTPGKFHHTNVEDIIILEVCAGSARQTKTARAAGFKGVPVDHSIKRSWGVDICIFDLTDPSQLSDLLEYIRKDSDRHCKSSPRTSYSGSQILPKATSKRSPVEMANQLYDAVLQTTECAVDLDICVAIENPANSHYWSTTPTKTLLEKFGDQRVTLHACAHGGSRDKLTSIWQSKRYFDTLELRCDKQRSDKQRSHSSWRPVIPNGHMTYPTAEEAAYPYLLCERIIACVMTQVVKMGAVHIDNFQQQNELQQSTQQLRIAMGALPRGSKFKPLVAEFQRYENVHCDPLQQPQQIDAVLRRFPEGARVTHRRLVNGEVFRGSENFPPMDKVH